MLFDRLLRVEKVCDLSGLGNYLLGIPLIEYLSHLSLMMGELIILWLCHLVILLINLFECHCSSWFH